MSHRLIRLCPKTHPLGFAHLCRSLPSGSIPAGSILRDVLGWKYVAEDWDNDWLIFKSGPSEMGVHPTHSEWEGKTYDHPRQHSIAIMCDDINATVDELRAKGAQFRGPIEEREYGRVIMMIVPGADDMQLYQPTHKLAYNL
jgi:hypothetical protein